VVRESYLKTAWAGLSRALGKKQLARFFGMLSNVPLVDASMPRIVWRFFRSCGTATCGTDYFGGLG
jgi:hypothetical protein